MVSFSISPILLNCSALNAAMANDVAGALVTFEGWVRNNNDGHSVSALEYEVFHDLALKEGQRILAEAAEKFKLIDAKAVHREGRLGIGDCAIWIGATSRHRAEAFEACHYIIDEIKHRLPVWKKEYYEGLEPQWVNCQHHSHHIAPATITAEQFYERQMRLPEVGKDGQTALDNARVLVVGVGGLGSSAAIALAAAGVGTIGLADHDDLSPSNLHRQTLYNAADIGKPKAGLAALRLRALNPLIDIHVHQEKATGDNVEALFADYDIILDCTDNFTAKYLMNDAALAYGKPVVQASIYRFEGQLITIDPAGSGGCLRCLFPEPPAPGTVGDCAETGVLGTVPMLFGTLQANEAIKRILNLEAPTSLMIFDLLSLSSQMIQRHRREDCPACGVNSAVHAMPDAIEVSIHPQDLLDSLHNRYVFVDVRESWEVELQPIAGAIHMPMSNFDLGKLAADPDQALLVICAKGMRSLNAAEYLRSQGWEKAYSLAGGIDALPPERQSA